MTALTFGQRMVRLDDGMKGVVAQNGAELRIVYQDRGEERLAGKAEKWAPDELQPGAMRLEERALIAAYADRALRAFERGEPLKLWEPVFSDHQPYDSGLFNIIVTYLGARQTRAAG